MNEYFSSPLYDIPKKRILKFFVNNASPIYDEIFYYINKYNDEIIDKNIDFDFDVDFDINNTSRVQLFGYDNNIIMDFEFEDTAIMFKNIFKKINNMNIYKVEKDVNRRKQIEINRMMLREFINN
jgi:hypothetical protein